MQLQPGDRFLVVADNCTDDTPAVARAAGAEVVERIDPVRRGKGYALDFGVTHLRNCRPDIVIVVDADCRLAEGTLDQLASACRETGRPAQSLYLMTAPAHSQINYQVAEFAWRVKNWLRPLGLRALNLPCQLMGTGMAFPWDVINAADLGGGRLVEDLILGLDLTRAGHPPLFCPSALVTSHFASSLTGAGTQRRRWEQGHIDTIVRLAPDLVATAVKRRNWQLLALAFDMAVPPISLLGMLILGMLGISALAAYLGLSLVPLALMAASLAAFVVVILIAWITYGREVLSARSVFRIPYYVVRKLGLYCQFLSGKTDARWTCTDRTKLER